MRTVFFLLCLFAAGSASAQTMTCGMELGRWVCRNQPSRQTPDIVGEGQRAFDRSYDQAQRMRAERESRQRAEAERYRQMDEERGAAAVADLRVRVGNLVREGQCAEARELALRAGDLDLDLAEQAVRLCGG